MITFPCDEKSYLIDGIVGPIELAIDCPSSLEANTVAVICHPHPQHGGSLQNKVVHTLARCITELGGVSIRFNFRGVGKSVGAFANLSGEVEDVQAVAYWTQRQLSGRNLWLAGFSFGAAAAIKAVASLRPAGLITVAPAVNLYDLEHTHPAVDHWLLIQGLADEIVSPEAVLHWAESRENPPIIEALPEVDHFFHKKLNVLRESILRHCRPWLV